MATDEAKESAHALTVLAFVKNKTRARVVSSGPRNISVVSGSCGNRTFNLLYNFFNLKYREK